MCRLLGYAAPSATTVQAVLGSEQRSVFVDMARLHKDGWGSAWIDEQDRIVRRVRASTAIADAELDRALTEEPSRARITHLRMATLGLACVPENTHPFTADGMAFAHNGSVEPPELIEHLLGQEQLAELVGTTDSERYFGAIRTRIGRGSPVLDAVTDTVGELRRLAPRSSLNALLLTPDALYAVHASRDVPIPVKEFARSGIPSARLPRGHMDAYFQMRMLRRDDGTVVVASSGLDITGWDALPPESVTRIGLADLDVQTVAVDRQESLIA